MWTSEAPLMASLLLLEGISINLMKFKAFTVGRRDRFRINPLLFHIAIYKGNISGKSLARN